MFLCHCHVVRFRGTESEAKQRANSKFDLYRAGHLKARAIIRALGYCNRLLALYFIPKLQSKVLVRSKSVANGGISIFVAPAATKARANCLSVVRRSPDVMVWLSRARRRGHS